MMPRFRGETHGKPRPWRGRQRARRLIGWPPGRGSRVRPGQPRCAVGAIQHRLAQVLQHRFRSPRQQQRAVRRDRFAEAASHQPRQQVPLGVQASPPASPPTSPVGFRNVSRRSSQITWYPAPTGAAKEFYIEGRRNVWHSSCRPTSQRKPCPRTANSFIEFHPLLAYCSHYRNASFAGRGHLA